MTWEIKTIKDLGKVVTGKTPSKEVSDYYENGELLFISPKDLDWNSYFVFDSQTKVTEKAYFSQKNQIVPRNAIFYTSLSFAIGKMGIASQDSLTNQQIHSIVVNDKNNFKFVYYLLQSYRPYIFSYNSGIDTPIVPKSTFEKIKINLPSLDIQTKIAGILSAYDELIENNKKRIALQEMMAEELYKEWFVRFRFPNYENTEFEKGMPKNWHTELIKNLVDRKRFGKLFKEDEVSEKGNIPVYDQSRDNFFGFYNGEPEHKASFENPIIIFGDHTCKMKILFSDFSLAENVIPFKAKDNVNLNYLFYLIKDSVKTTEYKRHWTELTNKKVLIAPIELQNKFSEIIQGNLKMIDNLVHQNFKLAESRDSLLPRLISGKLSVENLDVQQPPTPAQPNDSE